MTSEDVPWRGRRRWDDATPHFASIDHDAAAVYLTGAMAILGPLSPDRPPAEGEIYTSDRLYNGRYVISGVAKLGVARQGEILREWSVDPSIEWWGGLSSGGAPRYELFVHDRDQEGVGGWLEWLPLGTGGPLETARSDSTRLSQLTGDTVVWVRVLGIVDMY